MYYRSYCSKVKEQCSADMTHAEDAFKSSWIYHAEVMMAEFCTICIEKNLIDKMIDLLWGSEEDKHLHKSLFDSAREMPMKPNDSLLVVYYLRIQVSGYAEKPFILNGTGVAQNGPAKVCLPAKENILILIMHAGLWRYVSSWSWFWFGSSKCNISGMKFVRFE